MLDKYEIRVTARDISVGLPRDPESCPIALAVRRRTKRLGVRDVSVISARKIFVDKARYVLLRKGKSSPEPDDFIRAVDLGKRSAKPLSPVRFVLREAYGYYFDIEADTETSDNET